MVVVVMVTALAGCTCSTVAAAGGLASSYGVQRQSMALMLTG